VLSVCPSLLTFSMSRIHTSTDFTDPTTSDALTTGPFKDASSPLSQRRKKRRRRRRRRKKKKKKKKKKKGRKKKKKEEERKERRRREKKKEERRKKKEEKRSKKGDFSIQSIAHFFPTLSLLLCHFRHHHSSCHSQSRHLTDDKC